VGNLGTILGSGLKSEFLHKRLGSGKFSALQLF
jgi:hypothetical protein